MIPKSRDGDEHASFGDALEDQAGDVGAGLPESDDDPFEAEAKELSELGKLRSERRGECHG